MASSLESFVKNPPSVCRMHTSPHYFPNLKPISTHLTPLVELFHHVVRDLVEGVLNGQQDGVEREVPSSQATQTEK